jgi:hypothetical protein
MHPVKQKIPPISELIKIKARNSAPPGVSKEIKKARRCAEISTCVLELKHGPKKEIDVEYFDAENRDVALWSAHKLIRVAIKELKSDLNHSKDSNSCLVERSYASIFARMKGIRYDKDKSEFRDGFLAFENAAESAKQVGGVHAYEDALSELAQFVYSKIVSRGDGDMDAASGRIAELGTSEPEKMIRIKSYRDDSSSGSVVENPPEDEFGAWVNESQDREFPELPPIPCDDVTPPIRTDASSTNHVLIALKSSYETHSKKANIARIPLGPGTKSKSVELLASKVATTSGPIMNGGTPLQDTLLANLASISEMLHDCVAFAEKALEEELNANIHEFIERSLVCLSIGDVKGFAALCGRECMFMMINIDYKGSALKLLPGYKTGRLFSGQHVTKRDIAKEAIRVATYITDIVNRRERSITSGLPPSILEGAAKDMERIYKIIRSNLGGGRRADDALRKCYEKFSAAADEFISTKNSGGFMRACHQYAEGLNTII